MWLLPDDYISDHTLPPVHIGVCEHPGCHREATWLVVDTDATTAFCPSHLPIRPEGSARSR